MRKAPDGTLIMEGIEAAYIAAQGQLIHRTESGRILLLRDQSNTLCHVSDATGEITIFPWVVVECMAASACAATRAKTTH